VSGANGTPPGFSVGVPGVIRDQLRDVAERAAEVGMGGRVNAAFGAIISRPQRDPREFGEALYDLRGMRMQVRAGAIDPLYIEYGVHDEQPVVVIRRVRWLDDPAATA
jgi:hypothetical protein